MDFKEAQKAYNKLTVFLGWVAGITIVIGALITWAGVKSKSGMIVVGIIFVAIGLTSAWGMTLSQRKVNEHFELANIENLIKAKGMTQKQRARMARRIRNSGGR